MSSQYSGTEIAVIGLSGRYPKASSVDEFWTALCRGKELITHFTDAELEQRGVTKDRLQNPNYVKAASALDDIDSFDATFFGVSPGEARLIDPQHRQFLECAWHVFEDAGYVAGSFDGLIGVYAGAGMNTYMLQNVIANQQVMSSTDQTQVLITNDKDYLATRVSFKLDLRGPSHMIQSACSTSLVATHVACQSLLNEECDMALAGGVSVQVHNRNGYQHVPGGVSSPDGYCRPFDAGANGTVFGSGVGVVLLKRLSDAINDHDHIYAVIKGTAVNNDGAAKAGYTAPSINGLSEVVMDALDNADVGADTLGYVEAHGTGTELGDPIEIAGLTKAFRATGDQANYCSIGSVKGTVGHLDAAAGITGLIKAVLSLHHKQIPPLQNYSTPNPKLNLDKSPFYINTELQSWEEGATPRRAGVNSMGIGGTNAFVVLEEAEPQASTDEARPFQILICSGKTEEALNQAMVNLTEYLEANQESNLPDIAYTLRAGRKHFDHRRAIVCANPEQAVDKLKQDGGSVVLGNRSVAFLFSGQGNQYLNMAREVYQCEPVFKEAFDRCVEILSLQISLDLRELVFSSTQAAANEPSELDKTAYAQPALFSIEYALAQLWLSWGVHPSAMLGHSIGEYVAACIAGVWSLEDALSVVAARGRLMQQMPAGDMMSVALDEQALEPILDDALSIAAINTSKACVVSGPMAKINELQAELKEKGVVCRPLRTSHAFHSSMMNPMLEPFAEVLRTVNFSAPQTPFISNVTGTWITDSEATNVDYWIRHLRSTVRCSAGIDELLKDSQRVLIEIGPGISLTSMASQHPSRGEDHIVVGSLPHAQDKTSDLDFLFNSVARVWECGHDVDWSSFSLDETRLRVSLPTYSFARERYWIEPDSTLVDASKNGAVSDTPRLFLPSWKRDVLRRVELEAAEPPIDYLIFTNPGQLGEQIGIQLTELGHRVVSVCVGEQFQRLHNGLYCINPGQRENYDELIRELALDNRLPSRVIHDWGQTTETVDVDDTLDSGLYSLIWLAQCLSHRLPGNVTTNLMVLCSQLFNVLGAEQINPSKAAVLGPLNVIPQEYPNLKCRCIDVDVGTRGHTGSIARRCSWH